MPKFGVASKARLATCSPNIQRLMKEVIKHIDIAIVCGHRGRDDQDAAFAGGKSEVTWPNSKHNSFPSKAVDIAPYDRGIKWDDPEGFTLASGIIKGIAIMMGIKIRIGADWNGNLVVREHSFIDRPHIEEVDG